MNRNKHNVLIILAFGVTLWACNPLANPGKDLYEEHCQNCHAQNGKGLRGIIPSLHAEEYLTQFRAQLPCMVLYGIEGEMKVNGKTYKGKMPANPHLTAAEVSNILNYVQEEFNQKLKPFTLKETQALIDSCATPSSP